MSFEDEFDRIIRQKVEEADFSFDEENWNKARRLLDGERDSRLAGMSFMSKALVVGVTGLLLGGAGWLWWHSQHAAQENKLAQTEAAPVAERPATLPNSAMELPAGDKTNAGGTAGATDISRHAASTANATREVNQVEVSADAVAEVTNNHSGSAARSQRQPNARHQEGTTSAAARAANPNPIAATISGVDHSAANISMDQHNASGVVAPGQDKSTTNPPETDADPVVNQSSDVNPTALGQDNTSEVEELHIEQLALFVPQMPVAPIQEIRSNGVQLLGYFDDDYYRAEKYRKHYLNVEAGGNYLYGWAVGEGRDGRGLNWFGGANYGMYIGRHSDLSMGLQAYNITNMSQPFFDHSRTDFGFSSVTTRTTIAVHNLFYIAVPVRYTYAVNAQNSIGLSVNAGLLMSSHNVMTSSYSSDVKTENTVTKTKGYYEGMNPTNLQLGAFYRGRLGDRLYVNGELTWAPLNIFKYTESKINTANNYGLRVSLQYTLFDK